MPVPKRRYFVAAAKRKMRADFERLKKYVTKMLEKSVGVRKRDPINVRKNDRIEQRMSENRYRWWNSDEAVISTIAEERRCSA
jgi:hypothetical protein